MKEKILITGGSGFVGKNTIKMISQLKPDLKIYNLSKDPCNEVGVIDFIHDVTNFDFSKINIQFDYIVHLLASSHEVFCKNFEDTSKVNIDFTKKILNFCLTQKKLKKIIYMSSVILYDSKSLSPVPEYAPLDFFDGNYSFSKGIAEFYTTFFQKKFHLPIITFRLSNIYGPYCSILESPFLIPSKITQALNDGKIEVFNLETKRDWIYSEDVAIAIIKALDSKFNGILNLGSGQEKSVGEIIKIISKELNTPYFSLNKETSGPMSFCCNISNTSKILKWKPRTTLKNGITKTITYIKNNR